MKKKILVICSGGLDSTAVALLAHGEPDTEVTLLSFYYGQKAGTELERVEALACKYGMRHIVKDISSLSFVFGENQLTTGNVEVEDGYKKSVVVPLRNAMFLQIAMIYAYTHGYERVMLGSHLDDCEERNGERLFPDCSPEFFKAFELAMDLGTFRSDKTVHIVTPSMLGMGKKDLIQEAAKIDPEALFNSWSCYKSGEKHCGKCDSCRNRKAAFVTAGVEDKTEYEE